MMFRFQATNLPRLIIFLTLIVFSLSGCRTTRRMIWYNVPGIADHEIFPSRSIGRGEKTRTLKSGMVQQFPDLNQWAFGKRYKQGDSAESFFRRTGTIAFLQLRNDTIIHEFYAEEFNASSTFTTFSLAKVFVSTLVGIAIREGKIRSVEQPIAEFLPEFRDPALAEIRIRNLLQMTSGLRSGEKFSNPFNRTVRMYYGANLKKATHKPKLKDKPGTKFEYLNLNTQILAQVLEAATGAPISEYMQEKIWKPAGMEADASWSLDREGGMEKAFCCINGLARDFARFGLLFLQNGMVGSDTLVGKEWISKATSLDTANGSHMRYQYSWFTSAEEIDYYGQGLIGQYLYICPTTNTVIVRLGRKIEFSPWYDMFKFLSGISYLPGKVNMSKSELLIYEGEYSFGRSSRGDTSLQGKRVEIIAKQGYLKIKSDFRKTFRTEPESSMLFFNLKEARKLKFNFDEDQKVESIKWSRRGISWELTPKVREEEGR